MLTYNIMELITRVNVERLGTVISAVVILEFSSGLALVNIVSGIESRVSGSIPSLPCHPCQI